MELKYFSYSRISEVARMFKGTEAQEPQTRLKGKGSPRIHEAHIQRPICKWTAVRTSGVQLSYQKKAL